MSPSQDALLQRLRSNAALEGLAFEPVDVAGLEAVVARRVGADRAVALWRAARAACGDGAWPLLTRDNLVHPYFEPLAPLVPLSLAAARKARERVVRSSKWATAALEAIADAEPYKKRIDERDSFLEGPLGEDIGLVVVAASMFDAVRPFTPDGEGSAPRHAELVAMLRHFHARYGAEPMAAGDMLELEVRKPPPPGDLDALRKLARDFFLLSQGNGNGHGIERPARLLTRLRSDRWVVWFYGTTD